MAIAGGAAWRTAGAITEYSIPTQGSGLLDADQVMRAFFLEIDAFS
jgi:hypothetical protein